MADLTIEEAISSGVRRALVSYFHTPEEAVFELVDNSINASVHGITLEIRIRTNRQQRQFRIIDTGGTGFAKESLLQFGIWGEASEQSVTRYFDIGGKAALAYLGDWFDLYTQSLSGEAYECSFKNWRMHEGLMSVPVNKVEPRSNQPTSIFTIHGVDRSPSPARLQQDLGVFYAPRLRDGRVKMWVNKTEVKPSEYSATDILTFERETNFGMVKGWAGLKIGDARGGIRCYIEERLIKEREFFGFSIPQVNLDGLIGEAYLPIIPFEPIKRGVDEGSPEWGEVKRIIAKAIEPLIRRLAMERAPRNVKLEKELSDFVNKIIKKIYSHALELGRKPPIPVKRPTKKEMKKIKKAIKAGKETMAPPKAVGDMLRGGIQIRFSHQGEGPVRAIISQKVAYMNLDHPGYKMMQAARTKKALGAYCVEAIISELALDKVFDIKEYKEVIENSLWEATR